MSAIIQTNKDFEVFFRENFPSVYAFMKRYTGDDELAADLAQETFIRVYERRDEIVSVDYGKAFLYTVARHLYWNHCKHQRAKENYFAQLDESNVDDYDFLQEVTRQDQPDSKQKDQNTHAANPMCETAPEKRAVGKCFHIS